MRRALFVPLVCLAAATAAVPARAQARSGSGAETTAPQTEDQRKAQEHFQRARELYQAGKYSETISELGIARRLDPEAKDLVMNLAIVHEKLGAYDEAIADLRSYLEMSGVSAAERSKVEGMIKRIEGAKAAAPPSSTPSQAPTPPPAEAAPPEPEPPPAKGRVDGLTIGAGIVAATGIVLGTSLGIYALATRPASGFVTGRDGTYASLRDKTDAAHGAAIGADVSFAIAAVATVATAWLYFGRPKDASAVPNTARLTIAPVVGAMNGAALGGMF